MGATTQSSLEILGEMIEAVEKHLCPICGGEQGPIDACGFVVPGAGIRCRRLSDENPQYLQREKILRGLQLLLAAVR